MPALIASRWLGRVGLSALALALVGCGVPVTRSSGPGFRVVTTFVPITLFTKAVAGDCAQVTALIPPQVSPHDFQSSPADLAALRQAQVLVINGLGMERFLDKLTTAADNRGLRVIDSSQGVPLLASAGHGPKHDHGDHDHGAHDHGGVNPHIWLDPQRAMQQVRRIRDGLIAADPSCTQGYVRRAQAFLATLQALDHRLAQQLSPFRGKTFVSYHDIAPYFAQRYGLSGVTLVDVPGQSPSPKDMQRVSEAVQKSQLNALLSEPQQGPRSFNALARDLGVRVSVFDPLETATPQQVNDPNTYVQVMERNVDNMLRAFQQ